MILSVYVPYDPAVWSNWWNSVMTTIGATVNVGFIIFGVIFCVAVFRMILRHFM